MQRYLHNVPCVQLLAVAEEMLEGEIKRRGETAEAALVRQRVDLAAARADLPVSCARGKAA